MKLKIEAVYGNNKSRKSVSMEVSEEVAQYFIELFRANNAAASEDERPVSVEGGNQMRINLSVLHTESKF